VADVSLVFVECGGLQINSQSWTRVDGARGRRQALICIWGPTGRRHMFGEGSTIAGASLLSHFNFQVTHLSGAVRM
jgi:hypothetical protein